MHDFIPQSGTFSCQMGGQHEGAGAVCVFRSAMSSACVDMCGQLGIYVYMMYIGILWFICVLCALVPSEDTGPASLLAGPGGYGGVADMPLLGYRI